MSATVLVRATPGTPVKVRLSMYCEFQSNGCITWTGHCDRKGYGKIKIRRASRLVHDVAYREFVGVVPDGLQLDHTCRNPPCFNWTHLEPVTPAENSLRNPNWAGHRRLCGHLMVRGQRCRECKMPTRTM